MPPEKPAPDDPREWLRRARSNLLQEKASQPGVYLEDLCFQCQQAAEKSFKALLLSRESSFPYTHDLARLPGLIEKSEEVPERIREAARLTDYAVETRYPGVSEPVEQEEYEEAIKLAENVVSWVESKLADEPETPSNER
jgi:HEPN domain-containing protein